jgi:GMP synthase (glutamine-hydrolysing)
MKKIAIVDFGGQYTHLIARRIRDLGVYSEIVHPENFDAIEDIVGIIFSGGPQSVNAEDAFRINLDVHNNNIPILGICYGHQLLAKMVGGEIESGENKEYGFTSIICDNINSVLLENIESRQKVWMSHGDHVSKLPENFKITASSKSVIIAAYESKDKKYFGFQFHPEVTHTKNGMKMLENFIRLCTNECNWNVKNFKESLINEIKIQAGDKKLILLLSGGVDSLVAFELCIQAVGNENVYSIHVDTGFMSAEEQYLKELKGVVKPEQKRMIIGKLFVDIANKELSKLPKDEEWLLVQGTIYPDTIESGSTDKSAKIKTHHNRVDEIEKLLRQGKIIEPIKELYKDEVRKLGEELGLPYKLVHRHPFPGPGLAIRVICSDVTKPQNGYTREEKYMNEILSEFGMQGKILPIKSVGVQGDFRTYHHPAVVWFTKDENRSWQKINECSSKVINKLKTINRLILSLIPVEELHLEKLFLEKHNLDELREVDAILRKKTDTIKDIWQMPVVQLPLRNSEDKLCYVMRPVCSQDAMSADFYEMDFDYLKDIISEVQKSENVGDIFYDITTKPPGTIEWE